MILQTSLYIRKIRMIMLMGQSKSISFIPLKPSKKIYLIIYYMFAQHTPSLLEFISWKLDKTYSFVRFMLALFKSIDYYILQYQLGYLHTNFPNLKIIIINKHIMLKIIQRNYKQILNTNHLHFANFVVNNPTTGKPCASFQKIDGENQLKAHQKIINQGRTKWMALSIAQRKQNLAKFIQAFEKSRQDIITTIQQSTGKHRDNAFMEYEASLSVLKQDLIEKYPGATQKTCGLYYFKAFGNILVACDYRMVTLSCIKYLILCGIAGDALILKPHRYGLPIAKKIEGIWNQALPDFPIVYCPVNNFADGLEYLVQKKNMGFVSYTGDIEGGNMFYHFMAQKSQILAESQFLLTSSDSAYILKDLNDEKLKKAAQNLSTACFMGGGNLFNTVKRIFVDEQVCQKFTQYFIQASKIYKINQKQSKCSPIITSVHIQQARKLMKQLKQYKGPQLKLLTEFEQKQSYKSLYISPLVYKVDGISTVEYWNKIYPMPICFIEAVSSNQSAIQHVNESIYGISCTIFAEDKSKIQEIGRMLDVGVVYGNRWGFTPGIPYSPRKRSGKGHSFSVDSFTNVVKSQSFKGFSQTTP